MSLQIQIIFRLFQYKKYIQRIKEKNTKISNIYSSQLAESAGCTPEQVRKDFSLYGIRGNKRAGYDIDILFNQLNEVLKKDNSRKVIIIGAGNLGKALMNYEGFKQDHIEISALFDIDSSKFKGDGKPPILPIEDMFEFVSVNKIELGIISVPYYAAQQTLDLMVLSGIKGVINFAPVSLKFPKDIFISNINLSLELETVSYFKEINKQNQNERN